MVMEQVFSFPVRTTRLTSSETRRGTRSLEDLEILFFRCVSVRVFRRKRNFQLMRKQDKLKEILKFG